MAAGNETDFVITRTFDAPRDLVWKAWTEKDRLMKWFGPKGFTMPKATLDFRPGGIFHYNLRAQMGGAEMWGKWVYREITAPERIVLVHSFADEKGTPIRHPMAPDWPLLMLSTSTFTEKDRKTTVTIRWAPMDAGESEIKAFNAGKDGMKVGWGGTFDQLDAYLAKEKGHGR